MVSNSYSGQDSVSNANLASLCVIIRAPGSKRNDETRSLFFSKKGGRSPKATATEALGGRRRYKEKSPCLPFLRFLTHFFIIKKI